MVETFVFASTNVVDEVYQTCFRENDDVKKILFVFDSVWDFAGGLLTTDFVWTKSVLYTSIGVLT